MTLIILNILVWLGPFFISLRKGTINTLHPQFILPIFIIYFILNSYIQDQTNWMAEGERGIIVGIVKLLPGLETLTFSFEYALFITLLSGIFFHLGSRVFNKPIYNSLDEMIILNKKRIINGNEKTFLITAIIISFIVWLPNYFIPSLGLGTFWTFPLALSVCFIPVAIFETNKFVFLITISIALFVSNYILLTKAAFAFIILPMMFYYFFFHVNLFKIFSNKRYLKNFLLSLIIFFIFSGSLFIGNQYGKMIGPLDKRLLFRRDYAFETFAILVESKKLGLLNYEKSWIKNEIFQALPTIIYEKKRTTHINPAKRVALELFPETAVKRPNTYWNRHMLFAGYYDLGIFGSLMSAFIYGLFFSYLWKITKEKVKKYKVKWPIFVYLPLPSFGSYFLAVGNYAYATINFVIASIIIYFIFLTSRLKKK